MKLVVRYCFQFLRWLVQDKWVQHWHYGFAAKDKELTEMIKGALPVGILGIGEPLIYGVTLPLGRPFITACIGGGIGGAVIGMIGNVGAIAIGPSGAALIPLISDGKWLGYILGLLAAYAGASLLHSSSVFLKTV